MVVVFEFLQLAGLSEWVYITFNCQFVNKNKKSVKTTLIKIQEVYPCSQGENALFFFLSLYHKCHLYLC